MAFSIPPGYRRSAPIRRPKLDGFTGIIDQWLSEDRERPRKQRHSAKRIFERLRDEHGFEGGYTIIKDYVREHARQHREMFVPLDHAPGHAQADFGEAVVVIGGVEQKAHFFALDLPHSDACYVRAYPAATAEAWMDGHVHAFGFFGAVPLSILFDNDRCLVAKIEPEGTRRRAKLFSEMLSHYVIRDRYGRPGKGNDKGSVEGLVGYSRRNFMVPIPNFPTWDGGRHVSVDLMLEKLPPQARRGAEFLRDGLIALALISLVFGGSQLAQMVGGVSTSLQWPNWVRYAIIPSAGVLALVFLLLEDSRNAAILRNGAAIALGAAAYTLIQYPALSPFDSASASVVMIVVFFVSLALGVPVAFAMVLGVVTTTWSGGLLPTSGIIQNMVAGSSKFILLAIPFFLTTGYLLNIGGLSTRLIDFASALFGHFRGGLAQINVFNSVLVGGISGSSGADAASTTKVLVPQMVSRGYSPAFACAVTAASSVLPNVLPPAIAMLVYASVSNVSIAKLFVAGIVPGLLIAAALMICNNLIARKRGYEKSGTRASCEVVRRTFLRALPALVIAVAVLGCIRFGITTATEAGVIALVWAFILGKFVFREYNWRQLGRSLADCCVDSALIGFLIAASVPFAWVLIADGLPQQLVGFARDYALGPTALIAVLVLTLFVAGFFLDLTPAILTAAPLFLPLLTAAGFDPVQIGIIIDHQSAAWRSDTPCGHPCLHYGPDQQNPGFVGLPRGDAFSRCDHAGVDAGMRNPRLDARTVGVDRLIMASASGRRDIDSHSGPKFGHRAIGEVSCLAWVPVVKERLPVPRSTF